MKIIKVVKKVDAAFKDTICFLNGNVVEYSKIGE